MKRLRPFLAALACVSAMAATTVAVAHADPPRATWTFTDCTGPPGTPSTFDAVAALVHDWEWHSEGRCELALD